MTDQRRVEEQLAKLEILVTEEVSKGRQELQSSQAKVLNSIDEMINDATAALASLVTTYREKLNKLEEYAIENEVNPDTCVRNAKEEMEHYEKEALNEMTLYVEKTLYIIDSIYEDSSLIYGAVFEELHKLGHRVSIEDDIKELDETIKRRSVEVPKDIRRFSKTTENHVNFHIKLIRDQINSNMEVFKIRQGSLLYNVKKCIWNKCVDAGLFKPSEKSVRDVRRSRASDSSDTKRLSFEKHRKSSLISTVSKKKINRMSNIDNIDEEIIRAWQARSQHNRSSEKFDPQPSTSKKHSS